MGSFFVRRPIVAIVIAIITVIVGTVFLLGLPIEQYPNITPSHCPGERKLHRRQCPECGAIRGDAARAADQWCGQHDLYEIHQCQRRHHEHSGLVRYRTDPDMNTVFTQNRVSAATAKLPEEVKRLGVTTKKTLPIF